MNMDILGLPNEILLEVFDHVPQNDLVESRLVSKKWRDYIDALVCFRIKLNDTLQSPASMEEILNLRIRSCEIVRLKLPFISTFSNPLLVKEIVFTNTSTVNVKKILTTCTDVEKVAIFTTFVSDNFFDLNDNNNTSMLNRLKKLRELEIGIQVFNTKGPDAKSSVFESLFGNPSVCFFSLRRIFMHYPMSAKEWTTFFQFLGRHAPTLKSLKLRCFDCPSGMSTISPSVIMELKKVKLSTLELICNCNCGDHSGLHDAFSELVAAQHTLETLTLDFHKCPLSVFKAVIRNCQETLQLVKLCKVEFGVEEDIQGSMFSECLRLRKLKLHCLPRVMVYVTLDMDFSKISHANRLVSKGAETFGWCFPKNLRQLSVKSCHIPTEELIEMSTDEGCSRLTHLELYNVGTNISYGYGITFDAFVKICGNLEELELFSFRCATYSSQDSEKSENTKWAILLAAAKRASVYTQVGDPAKIIPDYDEDEEDDVGTNSDPDLNTFYSFKFEIPGRRNKFLRLLNDMISQLDVLEPSSKRLKLGV